MTPFKTNQELEIEKRDREQKINESKNLELMRNQMNPPQSLLKFELNQPQQLPYNPAMMPQQIYPSPYVPVPNPYYPYAPNLSVPWAYTPNNIPVIKRYNISLGGPNGDITRIANLYEDILPSTGNVINNTFNTLKERMIIHRYIRSIFVKTGDGEELLINGGPNNTNSEITNLLSHVKLLEINPYHFNRGTDNPYKTLPDNFVMYRSCYPIRMGKTNNVECSKSSIGINVRIYLLSKFDELVVNTDKRNKSDIWRELDYYQYVREEIIKPNISPNFICLHSYYTTKNTGINFKKFREIKSSFELGNRNIERSNAEQRNKLYKELILKIRLNDIRTFPNNPSESDDDRNTRLKNELDIEFDTNKFNHMLDSDKCLVLLTEAPTQILYDWATRTYKVDNGPIKKMVQSGYHDDKVWKSLFFQLLLAMLIMYEKDIMFQDFSLENNVYVKDLRTSDHNIGVWKYIYNGIEYFVPNYGYLLLIDSNFANLGSFGFASKSDKSAEIEPKILSKLLFSDKDITEVWKKKILEIFNNNIFLSTFTNYGGVPPSQEFINDLGKIHGILKGKTADDIKSIPSSLMTEFKMLHSRVGTPVKDNEQMYVSSTFDYSEKNYGTIVVRNITSTFSIFVIYLGDSDKKDEGIRTAKILDTKEPIFNIDDRKNAIYEEKDIPYADLKSYYGIPDHVYEPGKQYNLLETYLISRNK